MIRLKIACAEQKKADEPELEFRLVRAHYEIIRRRGMGAQQCTQCGWVYIDPDIPKVCANPDCSTNREVELPEREKR